VPLRYAGIDLAWGERARTGVAVLTEDGRLFRSGSVRTDDEISAVLGHAAGEPGLVVAIDAPLIVPNDAGQRPCERLVGQAFGRYHAGAYPANRGMAAFNPEPRGARLARRFGCEMDPDVSPASDVSVAIEVYPHPAMVSLFGLERVLPYKSRRGRSVGSRQAAFTDLIVHLERVCGWLLRLDESPRWRELVSDIRSATRPFQLDRVEDEIDAILCAYLAWLWANRPGSLMVHGDANAGYIVTPPPPTVVAAGYSDAAATKSATASAETSTVVTREAPFMTSATTIVDSPMAVDVARAARPTALGSSARTTTPVMPGPTAAPSCSATSSR
jgi:predicted RNase H-like nuclease